MKPYMKKEAYKEKDPLAWEEIKREHIVKDEWIDFRRSSYRFPDGSVYEPFYTYSRRDYVVIVASDTHGRYLVVRQFRQGIGRVTNEFPAGGVESKDGKDPRNESEQYGRAVAGMTETEEQRDRADVCDALTAAKRELLEETGFVSENWSHLLTVPSNATLADNYAHLFAAKDCRRISGQDLDETEFLNVSLCTAKEIEEMIDGGEFQQAVHIMAWLLSLRENKA